MNRLFIGFWLLFLLCSSAWSAVKTYSVDTTDFRNPERGWYVQGQNTLWDGFLPQEAGLYNASLVRLYIRLDPWKQSGDISDSALTSMRSQLNKIRVQGFKVILRFAYNFGDAPDASASQIKKHIHQLRPIFSEFSDIIWVVEAGFIGFWGEWHSSTNGLSYVWGDTESYKRAVIRNRTEIVDSLLLAIPEDRFVLLRYPKASLETESLADARLGHHNDCFLASIDDWGTYSCTDWHDNACHETDVAEHNWLSEQSLNFPVEGETCNNDPIFSACDTALKYLELNHWDALHRHYLTEVVDRWALEGCYNQISRRLGYRFELVSVEYPDSIQNSSRFQIKIEIKNTGFGKLINPRRFQLGLSSRSSGEEWILRNSGNTQMADPGNWKPGGIIRLEFEAGLLNGPVSNDSLQLWLALPDADPQLALRPEYSIRLANPAVWQSTTGRNSLQIAIPYKATTGSEPGAWYEWFARPEDPLPGPSGIKVGIIDEVPWQNLRRLEIGTLRNDDNSCRVDGVCKVEVSPWMPHFYEIDSQF
jgi:hypothetical protein